MSRAAKGIVILLVMVGGATGAHAESEQYCFDHLRAVEAQIKRAETAGCPITSSEKWHWTRDSNQQFTFCRNNEAKDIQYWHNQRESELTYCEANAASVWRSYPPSDIRIAGGPGDYTVHWTIRTPPCSRGSGIDHHCFVQIRFETPAGRPENFARQLRRYEPPNSFTAVRADRYAGQPGDVIRLKWQGCSKGGIPAASCEGFKEFVLVMPPPVPEFKALRIVRLDPSEYVPDRYRQAEQLSRMAKPENSYSFHISVDGTREAFQPALFQDSPAWAPMVRLKLVQGQKTLHESRVVPTPPGGTIRFEIPTRVLNTVRCTTAVAQTGVCRTLDVYAESFRAWTSGRVTGLQEPMGTSHAQLRLVRADHEALRTEQAKGGIPQVGAPQGNPSALISPSQQPSSGAQGVVRLPPTVQSTVPQQQAMTTPKVPPTAGQDQQARIQNPPSVQKPDDTRGLVRPPPQSTVPRQQQATTTPQVPSSGAAGGQRAMVQKTPTTATAQACQALCNGQAQCKAWTWADPQKVQGPDGGKCWLRNTVPAASESPGRVSGVK